MGDSDVERGGPFSDPELHVAAQRLSERRRGLLEPTRASPGISSKADWETVVRSIRDVRPVVEPEVPEPVRAQQVRERIASGAERVSADAFYQFERELEDRVGGVVGSEVDAHDKDARVERALRRRAARRDMRTRPAPVHPKLERTGAEPVRALRAEDLRRAHDVVRASMRGDDRHEQPPRAANRDASSERIHDATLERLERERERGALSVGDRTRLFRARRAVALTDLQQQRERRDDASHHNRERT